MITNDRNAGTTDDQEPDIDFDQMMDQGGGDQEDVSGGDETQEGEGDGPDLDALARSGGLHEKAQKSQQKDEQRQSASAPGGKGKPTGTDDQSKGAAQNTATGTLDSALLQRQWEAMGHSTKLPSNLSSGNLLDVLKKALSQEDHPEVQRMRAMVQQGGDPVQYIKSYGELENQIALDDDALVKQDLQTRFGKTDKRPTGWDEAKVNTVFDGMRKDPANLAIKAEEIREALRQKSAQRAQENGQYQQRGVEDFSDPKVVADYNKRIEADVRTIVEADGGSLYGLNLKKAENVNKLIERAQQLWRPDADGIAPFVREMQENGNAVRVAVLWDLAKRGYIKTELKNAAQGATKRLLENADRTPPKGAASRSSKGGQPNLERLAASGGLFAK